MLVINKVDLSTRDKYNPTNNMHGVTGRIYVTGYITVMFILNSDNAIIVINYLLWFKDASIMTIRWRGTEYAENIPITGIHIAICKNYCSLRLTA